VMVTWAQFKKHVEANGVNDESEVCWIDIHMPSDTEYIDVNVDSDGEFTVSN